MKMHTFIFGLWCWLTGLAFAFPAIAVQSDASESKLAKQGVAIIRPRPFASALNTWKQQRSLAGYYFYELDSELDPFVLRKQIQRWKEEDPQLRYVLLAADAPAIQLAPVAAMKENTVPTFYQKAVIINQYGSEETLASDLPYADVDGDGVPDLAIGRIPADTPLQLEQYLTRVLQYENSQDFGPWRNEIQMVAGVGGFGALIDTTVELVTRRFLTEGIPESYALQLMYASPTSVYCPSPPRFSEFSLKRLNQGSMFWIYVGHGHIETLDQFQVEGKAYEILNQKMLHQVHIPQGSPVAVFLACYTGAFDAPRDALAEQLVLHPSGPIASIAATRVTMPYGMSCLGWELLQCCFTDQSPTIGDILLQAKQRMAAAPDPQSKTQSMRKVVDGLAHALNPKSHDLAMERKEHLALMHLLGDPTLKLRYPESIPLSGPSRAMPGESVLIEGTCPFPTKSVTLQLAYRRDQVPPQAVGRKVYSDTLNAQQDMDRTFEVASQTVLQACQVDVKDGRFSLEIPLPSEKRAKLVVRAYAEGANRWGSGALPINLFSPRVP